MALFKVNVGAREQEICSLRWSWEVPIPELDTSVFVVPAHLVKNREDHIIVLNRIARSIIEKRRGIHLDYVFTYRQWKTADGVREAGVAGGWAAGGQRVSTRPA